MKLVRMLKVAAVAAVTMAAVALPGVQQANATTTPYCVARGVYVVSGGCDGLGGPGHDRLVIRWRLQNSNWYYTQYGPWHDRYSSWQETRQGGGGYYAWSTWFEHTNS
jgi:hypothetical protein